MIGKVVFKGMPLEDSIIAISNTTQLNKLIGITNGYLELSYVKINKFITKLIIADNQFYSVKYEKECLIWVFSKIHQS